MLIEIEFTEGGRRYCYDAPEITEVGDRVRLPTGDTVTVVATSSAYDGIVESVRRVFKKNGETVDGAEKLLAEWARLNSRVLAVEKELDEVRPGWRRGGVD